MVRLMYGSAAQTRLMAQTPLLTDTEPTSDPRMGGDGLRSLLEYVTQEILAVTYWFDPTPHPVSNPVTIRFTGRRMGVEGKPQPSDQFVHDETIARVVPGSGPISVTARISGIHPGEWVVTAREYDPARSTHPTRQERRRRAQERAEATAPTPLSPALRWWRRWVFSVSSEEEQGKRVRTCLLPFARTPGIIPGIWGVLVVLGVALALVIQSLVIAHGHIVIGPVWPVWLVGIATGIVGAKVWFIALHQGQRKEGWCIQGFIIGGFVAATVTLVVLHVQIGAFLDAIAPGLMFGVGVGRIGCFFAGCCGGPLTASRWGMWSSDQRVGGRRIPTQLIESALGLVLGLVTLLAVLNQGTAGGAYFVATIGTYTLARQGILQLRDEHRKTRLGSVMTAGVAASALAVAMILLFR